MSGVQAAARLQERIEELCGASIRALTGVADLRFRGRRLHKGRRRLPMYAPHLLPSLERDDFAAFRGAADALALRVIFSDEAVHAAMAPGDPVERLLFDCFEQFRVESLAPLQLPGVSINVDHLHRAWSLAYDASGQTASARGLILYTALQVTRARVTAQAVVEETEDRIEGTRFAMAPRIGHHLAALRRDRHDQLAYGKHALAVAAIVAEMLADEALPEGEARDGDEADPVSVFGLLMDDDEDGKGAHFVAPSGSSEARDEGANAYRIFTRDYDRELDASAIARPELLAELRLTLDRRIARQHVPVPQLARALHELFADPTRDGWDSAQEEGRIDGRALARLVATPRERRIFREDREQPKADAALSFLLDCSGSMKAHAEDVALLVDSFARALELAGIASEVLGFTTGAWDGGRAKRQWLRAGKPAHPGRLNERLHLRFKTFDASWRQSRHGIAVLLKNDIFREGLDGEALAWAAARLAAREESRKVLVVVSDGSPMDGATSLANGRHYLDHHLRQVAGAIEQSDALELHGVGVGLDLSPYYGSSHVLDLDARIGNAMFWEVVRLLAHSRGSRAGR
jgi:cobaltochelatase CobT